MQSEVVRKKKKKAEFVRDKNLSIKNKINAKTHLKVVNLNAKTYSGLYNIHLVVCLYAGSLVKK